MSEIVSAGMLAKGDLFRLPRLATCEIPTYYVDEVRQAVIADQRADVRGINVVTGKRADLSLLATTPVERLESHGYDDVASALSELNPGETFTVTRWGLGFWA